MRIILLLIGVFFLLLTVFLALSRRSSTQIFASNSTVLNYTALGDSITKGDYFTDGTPGFVPRYQNYLGNDLGVQINLTNLGVNGLPSSKLLDLLKNNSTYRNSVKNANVITIEIGVIDYSIARNSYNQGSCGGTDSQDCLRAMVADYKSNFSNILAEIKSLNFDKPNTLFTVSDIYNAFVATDVAAGNASILVPYFNQMNDYIHSTGASYGFNVTNVYKAFNGDSGYEDPLAKGYLISSENSHPSATGSEIIATQFRNFDYVLLNKDTDHDGFSNKLEKYIGTDLLASCPGNSSQSAWPPDINNDGKVRISDVNAVIQHYGSNDHRYDLNGDGRVTISDVNLETSYYGRDCLI